MPKPDGHLFRTASEHPHFSEPDYGGFPCDPEPFRRFDARQAARPTDRAPVRPAVDRTGFPRVRPELKAGGLPARNGRPTHRVAADTSASGVRSVRRPRAARAEPLGPESWNAASPARDGEA
ncbi:hypothetical protein [Kitasatospora purpeofusca]|uniref:hypothetical protein n=1 Tax=Kitasatospora purpeofusca TaxID=67352 RepID=UPI0036D3D49C